MGEPGAAARGCVKNEEWISAWDKGSTGFHRTYINKLLEGNVDAMENGRSNLRIFVPLCGKSLDMKWLADRGHTVVGVELAEKAVEEFFQEQQLSFTRQPEAALGGTLYQSEDKKIQIYCCDLFKVSPDTVGLMDAMWDRGSMVAINVEDRPRYASLMQSLMKPGCQYLLAALQYDETKYGGPPHNISDEALKDAYGSSCTIKVLDSVDATLEEPCFKTKWGLDWMTEKLFVISPKQ